jgi:hypothetical protein
MAPNEAFWVRFLFVPEDPSSGTKKTLILCTQLCHSYILSLLRCIHVAVATGLLILGDLPRVCTSQLQEPNVCRHIRGDRFIDNQGVETFERAGGVFGLTSGVHGSAISTICFFTFLINHAGGRSSSHGSIEQSLRQKQLAKSSLKVVVP